MNSIYELTQAELTPDDIFWQKCDGDIYMFDMYQRLENLRHAYTLGATSLVE